MGRKLDLSGLTDNEAEHVLQVVQRDMRLRKKEEERLSELKQELDEEGSRCLLLSRQSCFNQRCCIRCCSPFTFLLNPKRRCRDCHYNVCKACRVYNKRDKAWLCTACQKSRLLRTQSLEWFYTNVKKRFKRFGSAKVLKTLYRKHLAENSALSELTEGSAYEDSIGNEGSVCGSDSAFYRQSEEHSMAETLSVALRVAEEAIDEAISKAEFDSSSQEKQNEALYLRQHRGELIEELAKTIVQKIVSRRKSLAEMRAKYDQDWPEEDDTDLHHLHQHQSSGDQASSSVKHQRGLWRSHSAFSLLDNDLPGLIQGAPQALKKEGGSSAMSTWKSVDRLDNAVLKSPDGNWIALQSAQLSRPSLLTKRKSLVYSALEKESGVVSAYERMGSDNETKPDPDSSWGAALQEIQRKMTDFNFNSQDSGDATPSTLMDSRDNVFSDSEGNWRPSKDLLALFRKKVYSNEVRLPSSSRRASIIDVNFNVEGEEEGEESEAAAEQEEEKVRTLPKKRTSKKESFSLLDYSKPDNHLSDAVTPDTLTSGVMTPDNHDLESDITGHAANQMDQELTLKLQQLAGRVSDSSARGVEEEEEVDGVRDAGSERWIDDERRGGKDRDEDEKQWRMEVDVDDGKAKDEEEGRAKDEGRTEDEDEGRTEDEDEGRTEDEDEGRTEDEEEGRTEDEEEGRTEDEDKEEVDEEMEQRFYRLVAQSRLTYFSSTDDELQNIGQSDGEWEEDEKDEDAEEENKEQDEESTEKLTYKLCQLEKEVRASQFSSTEDELDRVGVEDEERKDEDEELAVKVCRLASQINATQFSSTEDELDRAGSGGEEEMDEEALWKMQAEKAIHVAQLRDLSSLVSAAQFSSTEDELDRVGEKEVAEEGGPEGRTWEEAVGKTWERRESLGDLDVNMFDLRDENKQTESGETNDVQQDEKEEVEEDKDSAEERSSKEREDDEMASGQIREEKALKEAEKAHEPEEIHETGAEIITTHEAKVQQENRPEAKWPDKEEGEDRQEEGDIRGGKESQDNWETADSDEEDAEFNRIISSMLMMTLEDMQGGAFKDEDNKKAGGETPEVETEKHVKLKRESGFEDGDGESTKASQETGSGVKSQSRGDKLMSESTTREGRGEYASQQSGGGGSRKKESGDAGGGNDDRTKEQMNLAKETIKETLEAEQTRKQREVDADEQEDGVTAERQMMETHDGEAADGGRDRKDETKDQNVREALLSPQEIQMDSDSELYKTLECISALLEKRYSAVSLRSITTEVLKVLNATEELLQGVEGGGDTPPPSSTSLPPNTDPKKLDQQFSRLEENVYVAAGAVYSLEAELSDLEECARGICSATSDMELSFLEEQVASAAAKVQQSELQICDISARIAALKSAGLDVDTQSRATKSRIPVMPVTLDSSRQLRRRLPAPPVKEDKET